MSKSSVSSFEYKTRTEDSIADDVNAEMTHISKSICEGMLDSVGKNAIDSIDGIHGAFLLNSKKVIQSSKWASDVLLKGYDSIDRLSCEGDKYVDRAESLVRELGEL